MRERTITYTGTGLEAPDEHGAPQPGLILVFDGAPRTPLGYPVLSAAIVGRGNGADLTLQDPGVSRLHFEATPAPGGFVIRDLGSHNGTYVDGAHVGKGERFAPHGVVLRAGKALLLTHEDVRAYDGNVDPLYPALVGGPSLHRVRQAVDMVKDAAVPVLIEGETGSGKEVVARTLHEAGGRAGELVEVNCAALPAELVESELFGHARGSFSGSERARVGLFRTAHEGTLLLDEIGELPLAMQAKLLRVLETGQVRPVGEDKAMVVDVRVIAATNRSLDEMVEAGTFRRDLLHRIAATRITLPPLRERIEDLPLLCRHFLAGEGALAPRVLRSPNVPVGRAAQPTLHPPDDAGASISASAITASAMEVLLRHRWPGNARELRNVVRAAAASARAEGRAAIAIDDVTRVHDEHAIGSKPRAKGSAARPEPDGDEGKARILEALAVAGGNVTQAARDLGVARSGLYETLRRLKVDPAVYRKQS